MARTGNVILAKNINVDKNYKNVLAYTESEMYALVYANKTSELTNCSFIRDDNSMEVGLSYATCEMANYLAFKNTSYSSKWFFAFIDKIEYVSNAVTRIYYTIDIWSTWYDYWDKKPCYIIRQHSNTDVVGDNLVPEGLEHGEYVENTVHYTTKFKQYYYVVIASISLSAGSLRRYPVTKFGAFVINGCTYLCTSSSELTTLIQNIISTTTPEQGAILEVYMAPRELFDLTGLTATYPLELPEVNPMYDTSSALETIFNSTPTSLDSYYPVNKKLLTYPYQYILVDNHAGDTTTWRFENFSTTSKQVFYTGVPSVGTSILTIPYNYKLYTGEKSGFIGAKWPTLGWREDSYTNWLTQNAVNNRTTAWKSGMSIVGGTVLLAASTVTGGMTAAAGAGLIYSGTMSAVEASNEHYQHQIEPDNIKGTISAGDVMSSLQLLNYSFSHMSIKQDYAEILDRFFNKYGYKQNDIQTPLFGSNSYRKYWNYIQIASDEVAAIPKYNNTTGVIINANDLQMINNIFRAGVTIWKLNSNIGDFDYWNVIETPSPTPTPTPTP